MAKHEKMFPVRDESGSILPKFIFVRNSGRDENVRAGAEWVLNARMNDAKFFFDEDFRTDLDGFLDRTKTIVFQEKLGTVFGRSGRLANLASACAPLPVDSQQELELAGLAGKYAKADLSTGLVSELASLQGVVGGIYAARTGLPEEVSFAISSQYLAALPSPEDANGRTAVRLILADQLDKLAGYLGIGLEPSGSSDPYGLRRSVGQLIEAGWAWPQALRPFSELLEVALEGYAADGLRLDPNAAVQSLSRLFVGRYGHLLADVRHDILEAVTSSATLEALTSPKLIRLRAKVLTELASNEPFVQAATRPLNILAAARKKGYEFDADVELSEQDLNSRSGLELHKVAAQISQELDHALAGEKVDEVVGLLLKLEGPINYFFEETMVMAEDPVARKARLSLVARVSHLLLKMGDFTKVTFAGTA
jgi:glycyl-tRNA synthetase beta chain